METSEKHLLTWEEAKTRSGTISAVKYDLRLGLTLGESYAGLCIIQFHSEAAGSTWVDFKAKTVKELRVNEQLQEVHWQDAKLTLPNIQQGANTAKILFENTYTNDGLGLHKYTDPSDGEVYLYSFFAPFAANKMFPCFDQPDLKAPLKLRATAPSHWTIIANEFATHKSNPAESTEAPPMPEDTPNAEYLLHEFAETPQISTYLYAICAGPYAEFRRDTNEVGVPLGLYCRKGLTQYLDQERCFRWTVCAFKFFNEFFGVPYPFNKYDQVFVPEFNMGAMENVGCVTFRDQYIFKDPPSSIQLTKLCDTFVHEMSHMWFGNLVTMKWWTDLWLNESFATFMSHLCISLVMTQEHPAIWTSFLGLKGWGYSTDQLSTTHAISTPVGDTDEAESNLDGISYAKGSAVLKQLYFLVGHDVFKRAIQRYMSDFAFANAEFGDLVRFISEEAQSAGVAIDIEQWAESWVRTPGLNELEPLVEFTAGTITGLKVRQTVALPQFPTLRRHRLIVELFESSGNSKRKEAIQINDSEFTEIHSFDNESAACILLNAGDWDFCKIRVDDISLQFLKQKLSLISDQLSRQLIWRALFDMVRDLRISGAEFVEFAILQLPQEPDAAIGSYALDITATCLYHYISNGPTKDEFAHSMFLLLLDKIRGAATAGDSIIYQKKLLSYCSTAQDIECAVGWVRSNSTGVSGFELAQGDRWRVIKKYAAISLQARELLQTELQRDSSDTGHLSQLYCESALPVPEGKAAAWEKYMTSVETMSRYEREVSMQGFNQEKQKELLERYFELYFEKALEFLRNKGKEASKDFVEMLLPAYEEEANLIPRVKQLIEQVPAERFDVIRSLKETVETQERLLKGKILSSEYLSLNK